MFRLSSKSVVNNENTSMHISKTINTEDKLFLLDNDIVSIVVAFEPSSSKHRRRTSFYDDIINIVVLLKRLLLAGLTVATVVDQLN